MEARGAFAARYSSVIQGYLHARWRGKALSADVDDAMQEVFMACMRPGGLLEQADAGRGDFRGFLYATCRNVALRLESKAASRHPGPGQETGWMERVPGQEADQGELFDRAWARAMVREARQLLVERAQDADARRRAEILELRFGGDQAIREIAARWQVPAQEVHNAYRKAREEFSRCLRDVVAQSSPSLTDVEGECQRLIALL